MVFTMREYLTHFRHRLKMQGVPKVKKVYLIYFKGLKVKIECDVYSSLTLHETMNKLKTQESINKIPTNSRKKILKSH